MQSSTIISEKMEKIKTLFLESKEFVLDMNDSLSIVNKIENSDKEFRSVSFEGISMALAETDIAQNNFLNSWKIFLEEHAKAHSLQFHVGLGWALAKANIETSSFLKNIEPFMVSRVLDGMGYYDGIFRNRQTIKSKKISEKINLVQLKHYDQGLGRSIWYSCLGNIIKCKEVIDSFPPARQADLWRGLGIACVYVGGCDEKILTEIYSLAGEHQTQLLVSVSLVAKGRFQSNTIMPDTELACKLWCNLSANEIVATINKLIVDTTETGYEKWIKEIEKQFQLALENRQ